jgi:hypothetical protein
MLHAACDGKMIDTLRTQVLTERLFFELPPAAPRVASRSF